MITKPYQNPKKIFDIGQGATKQLYLQLKPDYPDYAIDYVRRSYVEGPKLVPLDRIDFSDRAEWSTSKQSPALRQQILVKTIQTIREGRSRPTVLAKIPHAEKLFVCDAHNRLLAYEALGQPTLAYIIYPQSTDIQACLQMHSRQKVKNW